MIQKPLLEYMSKNTENMILKRYLPTHVDCDIIHNRQQVENLNVYGWMDKEM